MKTFDFILLSDSDKVVNGLFSMMENMVGPHDIVHKYVDIPNALFIIEIAKRAEDKDEWFPRGQWATIQMIQSRIEEQLDNI